MIDDALAIVANDEAARLEEIRWSDETSSPLHAAAIYEAVEVLSALLEEGSWLVDGRDAATMTPCMHAAASGHAGSVDLLLRHGADPNAATSVETTVGRVGDIGFGTDLGTPSGWTPLHFAASHARVEATKRLLLAGADPRCRDGDSATPFDVCLRAGALSSRLSDDRVRLARLLGGEPPSIETLRAQVRTVVVDRRAREVRRRQEASARNRALNRLRFDYKTTRDLDSARLLTDDRPVHVKARREGDAFECELITPDFAAQFLDEYRDVEREWASFAPANALLAVGDTDLKPFVDRLAVALRHSVVTLFDLPLSAFADRHTAAVAESYSLPDTVLVAVAVLLGTHPRAGTARLLLLEEGLNMSSSSRDAHTLFLSQDAAHLVLCFHPSPTRSRNKGVG